MCLVKCTKKHLQNPKANIHWVKHLRSRINFTSYWTFVCDVNFELFCVTRAVIRRAILRLTVISLDSSFRRHVIFLLSERNTDVTNVDDFVRLWDVAPLVLVVNLSRDDVTRQNVANVTVNDAVSRRNVVAYTALLKRGAEMQELITGPQHFISLDWQVLRKGKTLLCKLKNEPFPAPFINCNQLLQTSENGSECSTIWARTISYILMDKI